MSRTGSSQYLLDMALEHATRYGLAVLPLYSVRGRQCTCPDRRECTRQGKHPRLKGWEHRASRDPATLRQWWSDWPDANIGLVTGTRSGIVALDIDPRNGGKTSLQALEQRYGALPATPRSWTGSGGWHYFFRHPGGVVRKASARLGAGIDVLAEGSLTVAPPSLHVSGREYTWDPTNNLDTVEFAPLPSWLYELLTEPQRRSRSRASRRGEHGYSPVETALQGVEQGRRHDTLFRMVCSLRGRDRPREEAEGLALLAAQRCRPPYPQKATLDLVADVYRRYLPNPVQSAGLSLERRAILRLFDEHGNPLQPQDVASLLGKSYGATKKLMAAMARQGQLARVGVRRGYIASPDPDPH